MSRFRAGALVAAASLLVLAGPAPTESGEGYVVVVNQANPLQRMGRAVPEAHGDLA